MVTSDWRCFIAPDFDPGFFDEYANMVMSCQKTPDKNLLRIFRFLVDKT